MSSVKPAFYDPKRQCARCGHSLSRHRLHGYVEPMDEFMSRNLCHRCARRAAPVEIDYRVLNHPERPCQGAESEEFFPGDGDQGAHARLRESAELYCARCPIMQQCRDIGEQGKEVGLWGGVWFKTPSRSESLRHPDLLVPRRAKADPNSPEAKARRAARDRERAQLREQMLAVLRARYFADQEGDLDEVLRQAHAAYEQYRQAGRRIPDWAVEGERMYSQANRRRRREQKGAA